MAATTPERGRPAKKTILIVDDHPVLRRGLADLMSWTTLGEPLAIAREADSDGLFVVDHENGAGRSQRLRKRRLPTHGRESTAVPGRSPG